MTALTFDTLSTARRLREKGLPQEHAEAIADEIRMGSSFDVSYLAIKEDIKAIHVSMRGLETKIDTSIRELETKIDTKIHELETKIDTSVRELETKIDSTMREVELRMTIRLGGMIVALGGLLVAIKYFG